MHWGLGMQRRLVTLAVGLLTAAAAVVASSVPATAATAPQQSASAFWQLGDSLNTRVSLQASEQAGGSSSLFLFVTQSFCDTATDERVFRSFFAQTDLAPRAFVAAPLRSARLTSPVTVSGSEQRSPNCAFPGNPTSFTNVGASSASLAATWEGVGATSEAGPGVTRRAATATGSIIGTALNPGALGTAQFAELRYQQ